MRSTTGILIFLFILFFLDIYVYQAVRTVVATSQPRIKFWVSCGYWAISCLTIGFFIFSVTTDPGWIDRKWRNQIMGILAGFILAKITASLFLLGDDIRRGLQWIFSGPKSLGIRAGLPAGEAMSRSSFISWLGLITGSSLFGTLLYGYNNKYNYQLKRIKLSFDNLPSAFRGMRIVHISDIHSGSFTDEKAVGKGVEMILEQKPDLILFTGDLVNDMASEMLPYMDLFSKLTAPMGVYATLGNHDYGDYVQWPVNGLTKEQNLEQLKATHASLGWRLLMNEHVALNKDGQSIALLGIENWSAKANFPKYGRMDLAHRGTDQYPFKILLSHDPSHWEAEVLNSYPGVDLMLSGHTHGMQFGVELPGFRWSPVQYVYKQWAGLYEQKHQKLYVNRGYGFLGYPGRVGILPEITVIDFV